MEASTVFLLLWSFAWMVIAIFLHTANKAMARDLIDQAKRNQAVEATLMAVVTDEQFYKYVRRDIIRFRAGLKL